MKFLLDQDVFMNTARFLTNLGHDVVRVAQLGLHQASDEFLIKTAHQHDRIFVTRDRDYGSLVFVKQLGAGVLYLRMLPSTQDKVHSELKRVITSYSENILKSSFIVIDPNGHRIRRLP